MNIYIGIPILMIAAVIQSVGLENLNILGGRPDLVLLLVVTWAIIRGTNDGVLWGFFGGMFCDLLSGGTFGLWTLALTAVGWLAGQPWVHALGPTLMRLALMSVVGTFFGHGVLLVTMILFGYSVNFTQAFQNIAVPSALLNLILSPFAFTLLVWVHQRSQPRTG